MRTKTMTDICLALIAMAIGAVATAADQELELAAPFTDNMILQRQAEAPVWGFDAPGAKVTVEFAGQKKTAVADNYGDWMVKLNPLPASHEERSLKVTNNRNESIVLQGVLVGEVWFSSGQSNMVWTASKSMCSGIAREIAGSEKDIPIREINIDTVSALYPQKRATSDGGWKTHKIAGNFSALSLSFAYELYKELNMPIGILLSAHSNTRIEAFIQRQAIEKHPKLEKDVDLTDHYNKGLITLGDKWNHMISWAPGPWGSQRHQFEMPPLSDFDGLGPPTLGVALEGGHADTLPDLSVYTKGERFVDLFNRGKGPIDWKATPSDPWVVLSHTEGRFETEQRIWIRIDWDRVPKGDAVKAFINFVTSGGSQRVDMPVFNPATPRADTVTGFVKPGSVCNSLVSVIDIAPTILDLAGCTSRGGRYLSQWVFLSPPLLQGS